MKKILAILMATAMVASMTACATAAAPASAPAAAATEAATETAAEATEEAAPAADGDEFLVGLTLMFYDDPYFLDMRNTVKDYCDAKGWGFTEFDAATDAAAQSDAVENMIATGIDVLVIAPVDSAAIVPSIEKCNEKGIPVICVDAGTDGGEILSFVESDNYEAGVLCGETLVATMGEEGKICITNCPSGSAARDREEGFHSVIDKYPGIEILDTQESVSQTKGMEIGDTWGVAYPDLDGVFTIDDNSGLGVQQALKNAGVSCPIVSVDGSATAAECIADENQMYLGTAAQQPILIAVRAMEAVQAYKDGDTSGVEPHIQVPTFMVTAENAEAYLAGELTQYEVAR